MENNVIWIFIHLPKSGGTTMSEHLRKHCDSTEIWFHEDYPNDRDLKNLIEKKKNVRYIIGHEYSYGIHQLFPDKLARYVTFVRDPANRLLSRYNYDMSFISSPKITPFEKWYQNQPQNEMTIFLDRKYRGLRESKVSYPDFLKLITNLVGLKKSKTITSMVRFLAKSLSKTNHGSLVNAKKLLDICWVVAITEHLDEDLSLICTEIGIPSEAKRENISPKYLLKLSDELREKIYKDNPLDLELYNHALNLNRIKREAICKNYIQAID